MKMVKSLLLGTAAGLLAVAGAQAADMPVKAKPVEYVKICTPVRRGLLLHPGHRHLHQDRRLRPCADRTARRCAAASRRRQRPADGSARRRFTRDLTNDINYTGPRASRRSTRARRPNTARCGRTSAPAGTSRRRPLGRRTTPCNNGAANNCLAYWDRAFIQFAGFTVGRAQSFFDMFTYGGAYTYLNVRTAGDTGAAGAEPLGLHGSVRQRRVVHAVARRPGGHSKFGTCDDTLAGLLGDQWRLGRPTTAWPPVQRRAATNSASGFRTSSPTCASTRPGAISASAPRSTT